MPGTLFVVATPIGNLEDFTFRAKRTLAEVDLIAAEDTRRTAKLLAHYEIRKPVVSLREHNEMREAPRLVARLEAGEDIALVSDAGTPTVADPGARLVRAAREHGIRVIPIPGPSAVAAAFSASGLPGPEFTFVGFPPPKGQARHAWFAGLAADPRALVLFEAPHRVRRTLSELHSLLAERQIIVFREMSKMNEESGIYPFNGNSEWPRQIGEFTVAIGPRSAVQRADRENYGLADSYLALYLLLTSGDPIPSDLAIELVALKFQAEPHVVRKAVKKASILAKQQMSKLP